MMLALQAQHHSSTQQKMMCFLALLHTLTTCAQLAAHVAGTVLQARQ
jgi:hypothetical protein